MHFFMSKYKLLELNRIRTVSCGSASIVRSLYFTKCLFSRTSGQLVPYKMELVNVNGGNPQLQIN